MMRAKIFLNFFKKNKLSAQVSNACSSRDSICLLGDKKIDQLRKNEKKYLITVYLVSHLTRRRWTLQIASAKPINCLSITVSLQNYRNVEPKICMPPLEV